MTGTTPCRASPGSATGLLGDAQGLPVARAAASAASSTTASAQVATIASVTDGTSNSIIVGEVLPEKTANSAFYVTNGGTAGTHRPDQLRLEHLPRRRCRLLTRSGRPREPLGCRFSSTAKGFKSRHPGGANFLFADGSVKFLKASISMGTYCALGSRNGGEVISADAY